MGNSEIKASASIAGLRTTDLIEAQVKAVAYAIHRSLTRGTVECVAMPDELVCPTIKCILILMPGESVCRVDHIDFVEMWRDLSDGTHAWRVQLHRTRGAA